jgi:ribose/xylose/arabinose/galactoside ABC-type transport system permease subunit
MANLSKSGVPIPAVLLIGMLVGMVLGGLNATVISTFNLPPFIVTLSMASVYRGVCYIYTKMIPISGLPKSFISVGQGYLWVIPIPVVVMLVVAVVMWFIVNKTLFGRHAMAMGGNIEAAKVCGINVKRMRLYVFSLMGVCAAIAAFVLTGRNASAQPSAGQGMEMDAIAAVVLGGTPMGGGYAGMAGTVVGCLIVGVVSNILNLLNVDTNYQEIAKGVLILLAIIMDVSSTKFAALRAKRKAIAKG